jgi:hypothetical protein
MVRIRQLWVGDRFEVYDSLWTYTGASGDGIWATARKHSPESIALGEKGYGYIGDAICSFRLSYWVRFVPVSNPNDEMRDRHLEQTPTEKETSQ